MNWKPGGLQLNSGIPARDMEAETPPTAWASWNLNAPPLGISNEPVFAPDVSVKVQADVARTKAQRKSSVYRSQLASSTWFVLRHVLRTHSQLLGFPI